MQNNDNIFIIYLLNMGDINVVIPFGAKLGSIQPATVLQSNSNMINSLDHIPETDITIKEIIEQRKYISNQLISDDTILNSEQKELFIDMFMKYFDAVSVSAEDVCSSDLIQFHITLKPGTHPIHARCRP